MSKRREYKNYLRDNYYDNLPKSTKHDKQRNRRFVNDSTSTSEDMQEDADIYNYTRNNSAENIVSNSPNLAVDVEIDQSSNADDGMLNLSEGYYEPSDIQHNLSNSAEYQFLHDDFYENNYDDLQCDSSDEDYEEMIDEANEENIPQSFTKLFDMLQTDDSNEIINSYFVVNKAEVLLVVLKFSLQYSLPNSAIADL